MNNYYNRVLRVFSFVSAIILVTACKTPAPFAPPAPALEDPQGSLWFGTVEAEDPSRVYLDFILDAANPRPEAAELSISGWRVSVNGRAAKTGLDVLLGASHVTVPPGTGSKAGTAEIPVQLELDLPSLMAAGISLSEDLSAELELDISFGYHSGALVKTVIRDTAVFTPIQSPDFSIVSIAVLKDELINTKFRVNLKVVNPNPFPMELSSFVYELYGDGRFWADGQEKNIFKIGPRESREAPLFLTMNFTNMRRPILDQVIALGQVAYGFNGKAIVTTGIEYLPQFTSNFDLSGFSEVLER